jgi:flagellar motor component MotA
MAKNTNDVENNIMLILSQYSSRSMAAIQVRSYLSQIGELGRQFIKEKDISNSDELNAYVVKNQAIQRKGKGLERKEALKTAKAQKDDEVINEIFKMAEKAENEMQIAIEKSLSENPVEAAPINIPAEAQVKNIDVLKDVESTANALKLIHSRDIDKAFLGDKFSYLKF